MSVEICLTINDDGTMTVSKEDVAAEQAEGGTEETTETTNDTPVRDIKQALDVIKQMAEAASITPESEQEGQAMEQGFQQRF